MIKRLLLFITPFLSFNFIAYAIPNIEEWKTNEGARVLYIQTKELPMVDIRIALNAGSLLEEEAHGLASITATSLTRGTKNYDEESFMIAQEEKGVIINATTSTMRTTLNFRSLTDKPLFEESFSLFLEMLESPRFDEAIFNRDRIQSIDAQKALLDDVNAIANELFYQALYPNHHLGTTSEMLKSALEVMKVDDVKAFYHKYYHATGALIVIVGALPKEEAIIVSQKLSQSLGKGELNIPNIPAAVLQESQTITKFFDTPQSHILTGHPSINRFDEDFLPLILGNHVLGGSGLTSQLMIDIREKQGLTYGIYSNFNPTHLNGPFMIGFSTKNENVEHALSETMKLLNDFIKNGPDEEDLQRAKNNISGIIVQDLDSNAKLANALLVIGNYDLPLDYFDTYINRINAITKEEVLTAFKKHIHPDKMTTIIIEKE